MMLTGILVCILAVFMAVQFFKKRKFDPNYPPGPTGIPILGYLPFLGSNPFRAMGELSQKYGDLYSMSFGPLRCVVLNSLDLIRECGKKKECQGRPQFLIGEIWANRGTDHPYGLFFNNGDTWVEQRRFAQRTLKEFGVDKKLMENLVMDDVHEIMDILKTKYDGQLISPEDFFEVPVVNALWTIVSGVRLAPDDCRLQQLARSLTRDYVTVGAQGMPFILPALSKIIPSLSGYNRMVGAAEGLASFVRNEIKNHRKSYSSDSLNDFLDVYMKQIDDTIDPNSSFYKTEGELSMVTTVMDLFVAGTETTTGSLTWACLYLSTHPDVQAKVQQEMDDILGRSRSPVLSDKHKLPYLEAVMHETLRLASIAPLLLFHRAEEDAEMCGYTIPKDTILLMNAYYVMHDPKHWLHPYKFYPEHFIAEDGSFMPNDAFIPFGTGKRICLGEHLARMEFFLFLSNVLHEFTVELPPGSKPSLDFSSPGFTLRPKPFKVRFCKRK